MRTLGSQEREGSSPSLATLGTSNLKFKIGNRKSKIENGARSVTVCMPDCESGGAEFESRRVPCLFGR